MSTETRITGAAGRKRRSSTADNPVTTPSSRSSSNSTVRSRLPRFRAGRAFYVTLAFGLLFAVFATRAHFASSTLSAESLTANPFYKRDLPPDNLLRTRDEDSCRGVNHVAVADQCAFIHKNCPTDEGGFSFYLDLYYCRLAHVKPVAFIILILWLGLLFSTIGIAASDFFCENLESIAFILGISENVAGVTFVAFGNGSPDVFSTFAAMSADSGTLAVGELFGAAGFITAVVAGSMALIQTFSMPKSDFMRDTGFFTVAAIFSVFFLWDGKLYLWECVSMVLFYVFYVGVVLVMGWWKSRRRARRAKEAAIRGHFVAPGEELEHAEPYRDDPEEPTLSRPNGVSRGASFEDWSALERASEYPRAGDDEDDDEEEARDRMVMNEMTNDMRLNRPNRRLRSTTTTAIRPSLVGALEFQAVLKSLQKSQNYRPIQLHTRRFSDDPTLSTSQQPDRLSPISSSAGASPTLDPSDATPRAGPRPNRLGVPAFGPAGRARTVSANDAHSLHIDADLRRPGVNRGESQAVTLSDSIIETSDEDDFAMESASSLYAHSDNRDNPIDAVAESATPRQESPQIAGKAQHTTLHAPLDSKQISLPASSDHDPRGNSITSTHAVPRIVIPHQQSSHNSNTNIYDSPQTLSPFPQYRDSPGSTFSGGARSATADRNLPTLYLPSPLAPGGHGHAEASYQAECHESSPRKPLKWWPYDLLPPPSEIFHTLFPTIDHWSDRSWWGKCVGVSALPSVLLLTLTLPVVPVDEVRAADDETPVLDQDSTFWKTPQFHPQHHHEHSHDSTAATPPSDANHHHALALIQDGDPLGEEEPHPHRPHAYHTANGTHTPIHSPPSTSTSSTTNTPLVWNRWLLIVQLFTAPQFILLAIYLQTASDQSLTWLIRPCLIALLISTLLLIPLLLFTTPTHKPPIFHKILSNCGFIVSVAWISTVASQVVDGLKALAVICNMSHAIMGLTIFAVGNSLGDLVANVTLAQLGRPVMALSACFGGPLLNILLGIGLSGSYILIAGAEHRHKKHPEKHLKFKAYHIEVERTLIISACTLLLTLIGLMIALPLNKFRFGKKIGYCLIALWTVSTIANVTIEVSGSNRWK